MERVEPFLDLRKLLERKLGQDFEPFELGARGLGLGGFETQHQVRQREVVDPVGQHAEKRPAPFAVGIPAAPVSRMSRLQDAVLHVDELHVAIGRTECRDEASRRWIAVDENLAGDHVGQQLHELLVLRQFEQLLGNVQRAVGLRHLGRGQLQGHLHRRHVANFFPGVALAGNVDCSFQPQADGIERGVFRDQIQRVAARCPPRPCPAKARYRPVPRERGSQTPRAPATSEIRMAIPLEMSPQQRSAEKREDGAGGHFKASGRPPTGFGGENPAGFGRIRPSQTPALAALAEAGPRHAGPVLHGAGTEGGRPHDTR